MAHDVQAQRRTTPPTEDEVKLWLVEHYSHERKLPADRIDLLLDERERFPYLDPPDKDEIYRGIFNVTKQTLNKLKDATHSDATKDKSWTTSRDEADAFSRGEFTDEEPIDGRYGVVLTAKMPKRALLNAALAAEEPGIGDHYNELWDETLRRAILDEQEVVVGESIEIESVDAELLDVGADAMTKRIMLDGTENAASGFLDDDYDWGPLKPYMDGDTLVILVMDVISDCYWGSWLSAKAVQKALQNNKAAAKIKLVINSPGGAVHEGVAIYSLLVDDGRPITAHVIGLAASMASIILLAANTRILHTGSQVMIHEPALSWTSGNRHQLRSDAQRLDVTTESMLDIYVERTGYDRAELAELMAAETWLTAAEARRLGFGTEVAPVEPEPMMSAMRADAAWNARRGAALAKYHALPASVQQGAPLGWDGYSLAELRAANALADTHQYPSLVMALDGVRRAHPVAQFQPKPSEAALPPRKNQQPQPAATTSRTNIMPFPEELLRKLGLSASATEAEVIAALNKAADMAAQAEKAKVAAEAKAEEERLARIEAQARTQAAEELRKEQAVKEANARAMAEHKAAVEVFLATCTDGVRGIYEELCWTGEGDSREPNPKGLAQARRLADTSPGALKSSLAGPSAQAQAARQAATQPESSTPKNVGPVMYRFAGARTTVDLTRLTRITHETLAKRQAEMKARHEANTAAE